MSALIIRYCLMFDDRSEDPKDQIRMAEFIFSDLVKTQSFTFC